MHHDQWNDLILGLTLHSIYLAWIFFLVLFSCIFQPLRETPAGSPFDARTKHHPVLIALLAEQLGVSAEQIRDFELCLYDTQPAALTGWFTVHASCFR
jgi:hypothetical protein